MFMKLKSENRWYCHYIDNTLINKIDNLYFGHNFIR